MESLNAHDLIWCVRRLPKAVVKLMKAHPSRLFVAGGYVRSTISSEHVNDIDLFVSDKDDAKTFALELVENKPERMHVSDNAITVRRMGPAVQFIHRWTFATPSDALASFDFTIAAASFWWDGEKWQSMCDPSYYADLAAKRLIYRRPSRNEDAGGSMLRVLKFYQRGYRIPLDSLGAVVARLGMGVKQVRGSITEDQLAKVVTGLLREVDPSVDPDHIAHLPSIDGTDGTEEEV